VPWEGCVTGAGFSSGTIGLTRGRPGPRFAGGSSLSAGFAAVSAFRLGAITADQDLSGIGINLCHAE
jgi:ABC-type uncharacterized transport system permease subunit